MAVDSHTSIELRQVAASTNLAASIIGDWAKGHGFDEDWELAQWMENQAHALQGTDAGETVHHFHGEELAFHEMMSKCVEALRTNFIGTKLALVHSEISEALETLRNTGFSRILTEGNFGEELADGEIRLKHLANLLGIDMGTIEVDKIKANADRPYKHGRVM